MNDFKNIVRILVVIFILLSLKISFIGLFTDNYIVYKGIYAIIYIFGIFFWFAIMFITVVFISALITVAISNFISWLLNIED